MGTKGRGQVKWRRNCRNRRQRSAVSDQRSGKARGERDCAGGSLFWLKRSVRGGWMKYCRFQTDAGPQYGEVVDRAGTLWIERLLPPFEEDLWTRLSTGRFEAVPVATVHLMAPVAPSKIVCIGRNYREHAAELGNEVPKEPLLFLKAPSAVIAAEEAIRIPALSQRVDFEGELAVVIGRKATRIWPDEDVRKYIR